MLSPATVVQDGTSPGERVSGMTRNAFSQTPVFVGGKEAGTSTEGDITTLLSATQDPMSVLDCTVDPTSRPFEPH